jgi:hypothetical protein
MNTAISYQALRCAKQESTCDANEQGGAAQSSEVVMFVLRYHSISTHYHPLP